MIIKKYTGKTEEEAIEVAKKEMGDAVVLLSSKNVKRKGFFASLRSRLVEITVALEDDREKTSIPKRTIRKEPAKVQEQSLDVTADTKNIEDKLDSLQSLFLSKFGNAQAIEAVETTIGSEGNSFDKRSEVQTQQKSDTARETDKSAIQEKTPELIQFTKLLYNTMIDNEVDEKYANQILEEIERLNKPNASFDYSLANTYQKLVLKFGKTASIAPAKTGPKVIIFLGPTGVGKTTTIAKISGSLAVEGTKKVALLTADTYRIAAAEQLRTYANILEVPFRVIYTEEEFRAAVSDFKSFDYIFLDTAGHSHQNTEQVEKMRHMVECVDHLAEKQVFLVLSATTKYRDLLRIAEMYREITEYQLIFTKLDETSAYGNILNVKLHTNAQIAYVTYGQNVPDDIESFHPQKTVKHLLGGKTTGKE
ncbi:MAG: flagellar biosynthesis protein FlhF [Lachnospiraceae bacterium]|jgi:flagellar biosynthesis protein FlhF|nr:flagellar biosynthesis protein FlhF [Lachnospiraceae bacterium]